MSRWHFMCDFTYTRLSMLWHLICWYMIPNIWDWGTPNTFNGLLVIEEYPRTCLPSFWINGVPSWICFNMFRIWLRWLTIVYMVLLSSKETVTSWLELDRTSYDYLIMLLGSINKWPLGCTKDVKHQYIHQ